MGDGYDENEERGHVHVNRSWTVQWRPRAMTCDQATLTLRFDTLRCARSWRPGSMNEPPGLVTAASTQLLDVFVVLVAS